MEVLLNLLWLLLSVGTLVGCRRFGRAGGVRCSRVFILAGCLLAIVFPVVSASDDLSALRMEAEESNSCTPNVKKFVSSSAPGCGDGLPSLAGAVRIGLVRPEGGANEPVAERRWALIDRAPARIMGCRAPPCPKSSNSIAPTARARVLCLDLTRQIPQLSTQGLPHRRPQKHAAGFGPRSFQWEISLLRMGGPFRGPPRLIGLVRRNVRDPARQSWIEQGP
jgi:hypothetical protein